LPISGLAVFHFSVFGIVALAKEISQKKAAHPAFSQHPTTEQQAKCSPLLAFALMLVQDPFSFHGFAPLFD
jgi:hypothetical protein